MWQRNALLGISGRSGPWSGKGSIEAPTKGNLGERSGSVLGGGAYIWREGVGGGVGGLWEGGKLGKVLPLAM